MEKLLQDSQELAVPFLVNVGGAIIILVVGIWLAGKLSHLVRRGMELRQVDPTITTFVGRLVYYLLVIFVAVAVLERMGVQTASVIAVPVIPPSFLYMRKKFWKVMVASVRFSRRICTPSLASIA